MLPPRGQRKLCSCKSDFCECRKRCKNPPFKTTLCKRCLESFQEQRNFDVTAGIKNKFGVN